MRAEVFVAGTHIVCPADAVAHRAQSCRRPHSTATAATATRNALRAQRAQRAQLATDNQLAFVHSIWGIVVIAIDCNLGNVDGKRQRQVARPHTTHPRTHPRPLTQAASSRQNEEDIFQIREKWENWKQRRRRRRFTSSSRDQHVRGKSVYRWPNGRHRRRHTRWRLVQQRHPKPHYYYYVFINLDHILSNMK